MDQLIEMGYITRRQLKVAQKYRTRHNCKVGQALLDLGFITSADVEDYVKGIIGE